MKNRKIIYVDDKQGNLNAFKALLRRDFHVLISTQPQEALEMIGKEQVPVVITDFKMPLMNGVVFLSKVRELYPDTVRILLSGHADIEAVIESVNKGEVFRFIKKPWIDELLINEIKNAFELYDTRQSLHGRNKELRLAYEELAYFTYSAAHNLTGPVATLRGLLNLIKTEPEQTEEYLEYLDQTLDALNVHLTNIISFNKNKIDEMSPKEIDFEALLSGLLLEVSRIPGYADLNVDLKINQSGSFTGDSSRLTLIFSNIILNAIKYQDKEKQHRELIIRVDATEELMKAEFRDNGVGISEENLPRIFDIFFRESTGQLGSGIGLYIVKQAMDRLNGVMKVESEKGIYTSVVAEIPSLKA